MVLAVSALCLGEGPTVITNEVLDVPAKSQELNQHDWNLLKKILTRNYFFLVVDK